MRFIRQGATHKVVLGPAVAVGDGFTPVTTLALSSADEAEVILHDNGTVVDISGYTWAAIATADGYYHLTLQSGISGTVGHMTVVVNDDSLILPLRADFTVVEEAVYDALFAASALGYVANAPVSVAQWNGTNVATPTVAGVPEVDVTHVGGDAQSATDLKDFADAGYDPATNKVEGVKLADTLTTYTGNTPQTGDAYAIVSSGTHGNAAIKTQTAAIETDTQDIQSRLPAALTGAGNIKADALAFSGSATAADNAEIVYDTDFATNYDTSVNRWAVYVETTAPTVQANIAGAVWDEATLGHTTSGTFGEQLKTDVDLLLTRLGTPIDFGGGTSTIAANLQDLADNGTATYDRSTDSLQALRDRGDAAWTTATGFSTHSAADVWGVATRVLTAGTNIQLPSNGLANITAWTVDVTGSLSGSVGSVAGAVGSVTGNVGGNVAGSVGSVTGNVGGNVTGSVGSLATQAKADVNAEVLDVLNVDTLINGKTFVQAMKITAAGVAGEVSGAGTGTEVFVGLDGSTTIFTVTVDSSGNRSAVVYA